MTLPSVARGREAPRKTLHLTTAIIPVGLWCGVPQRTVGAALVALFGVACVVEFARRRSRVFASRFESTVGIMLRPHEATSGVTGATWLLAAFALTCLAAPLQAAIAATWAGAAGDASAAIVGRAYRRARANVRTAAGKTVAGSAACLVITALGAWWLAGFGLTSALLLGLAAAAVEWPDVSLDDNVRVTMTVALAATALLRN
jgi:dolichol kinase